MPCAAATAPTSTSVPAASSTAPTKRFSYGEHPAPFRTPVWAFGFVPARQLWTSSISRAEYSAAVLFAEVFDVASGGLKDSQAEEPEHRD